MPNLIFKICGGLLNNFEKSTFLSVLLYRILVINGYYIPSAFKVLHLLNDYNSQLWRYSKLFILLKAFVPCYNEQDDVRRVVQYYNNNRPLFISLY